MPSMSAEQSNELRAQFPLLVLISHDVPADPRAISCSWQQDKLDMAGMQEVTEAPVVQAVEAVLGTPQP